MSLKQEIFDNPITDKSLEPCYYKYIKTLGLKDNEKVFNLFIRDILVSYSNIVVVMSFSVNVKSNKYSWFISNSNLYFQDESSTEAIGLGSPYMKMSIIELNKTLDEFKG